MSNDTNSHQDVSVIGTKYWKKYMGPIGIENLPFYDTATDICSFGPSYFMHMAF